MLNVPVLGAEQQAAARLAVDLTVPPAVEAQLLRVPLQHQHAEPIVPFQVAEQRAAVRLAVELTAQPAVV